MSIKEVDKGEKKNEAKGMRKVCKSINLSSCQKPKSSLAFNKTALVFVNTRLVAMTLSQINYTAVKQLCCNIRTSVMLTTDE